MNKRTRRIKVAGKFNAELPVKPVRETSAPETLVNGYQRLSAIGTVHSVTTTHNRVDGIEQWFDIRAGYLDAMLLDYNEPVDEDARSNRFYYGGAIWYIISIIQEVAHSRDSPPMLSLHAELIEWVDNV